VSIRREVKYRLIACNALLLFDVFLHYSTLYQHVSIPVGIILRDTFKSENYTIGMTVFCISYNAGVDGRIILKWIFKKWDGA
jgi:hypothetical protein